MNFKTRLLLSSFMLLAMACESNKKISIDDDGSSVAKARTPQEDTIQSVEPEAVTRTVSGLVSEVNQGKDGYTAKIISPTNEVVAVTVSRINLKDPKTYKDAKAGDILSVTGEQWSLEGVTQITARQIN
ncbi:MAG TPA: hypothetical protein VGB44_05895 [Flavobacterium sp.]